jgi:electron transfer flavoprotein beta subunit
MQYKYAVSTSEEAALPEEKKQIVEKRPNLRIQEWGAAFVEADPQQIGMAGSPTKVKAIENVVFTAKESLTLENNDEQIENLVKELIANHTIG